MLVGESFGFLVGTLFVFFVLLVCVFVAFLCYKKYKFVSVLFGLVSVCISWGLFVEPYRLVVNRFEIQAPKLPKMKIAVVADFHARFGKSKNWVEKIVQRLQKEEFDLLLIPGDFLTSSASKYSNIFEPLQQIKQPIYFVTGNHDYRMNGKTSEVRANILRQSLQKYGLKELNNTSVQIADNFFMVGVSDNYLGFDEPQKAFENVPKNAGKILLAHSPDIIDNFNAANTPDLIISGHTHCGQIRLPFVGSISAVIPTRYGAAYDKHFYADKNLFVTCGVGESGPAVRFLNPPEINILDVN